MSIEPELDKIPSLANVGKAIVAFARTLIPGDFVFEGDQWVYRNDNFVTIRIQHARAQSLAFSLRGNPHEFEIDPTLEVKAGQNGYSRCTVDSPRQLAAIAKYIERALVIYQRGRARVVTTPRTIET